MIVLIFSSIFAVFSSSYIFSPTPPLHFSSTFPILRGLECVLYSAYTHALSGCLSVPTNQPSLIMCVCVCVNISPKPPVFLSKAY